MKQLAARLVRVVDPVDHPTRARQITNQASERMREHCTHYVASGSRIG